jgi:hypothetical protein
VHTHDDLHPLHSGKLAEIIHFAMKTPRTMLVQENKIGFGSRGGIDQTPRGQIIGAATSA